MFSVQSDDGEVACVAVAGKVHQKDVFQAGDPLEAVLGTGSYCRKVLLDLSGLQAIDSSGFCWLVRRQKRMFQKGGQLILHSASPRLGEILDRLKMDLILRIIRDRESAIRLARSHGRDMQSG